MSELTDAHWENQHSVPEALETEYPQALWAPKICGSLTRKGTASAYLTTANENDDDSRFPPTQRADFDKIEDIVQFER